jgi:hypothetical protein
MIAILIRFFSFGALSIEPVAFVSGRGVSFE